MPTYQPTPADQWLREVFANRSRLDATVTDAMDRCEPVALMAPNPTAFGRTFEIAVQLDQCQRVPRIHGLQAFPDVTAREMVRSVNYRPAEGSPMAPWTSWRRSVDELVDRADLHGVASCVAAYYPPIRRLQEQTAGVDAQRILGALYGSDPHSRYMAAEAPAFDAFMASYDRSTRAVLRRLGPAVGAPSLPGERTADLLVGRTIVEIKTGWLANPYKLQTLYDQMLGYGLLSLLTPCPVTHVAAYLGRYGAFLRFPLHRLLRRCAVRPVDLFDAAHRYLELHKEVRGLSGKRSSRSRPGLVAS